MAQPEKTDGFSFVFHATKITAGEIKTSFCIPVKRLKNSHFLLHFLSSLTLSPETYNENKRRLTFKDRRLSMLFFTPLH